MKRNVPHYFWRCYASRCERLIATAEQERQELMNGGIPDRQIVVRRNGIDVPVEFPPPGRFRNQWDISSNVKLVLFLGVLYQRESGHDAGSVRALAAAQQWLPSLAARIGGTR